jgi:hypothetical protein
MSYAVDHVYKHYKDIFTKEQIATRLRVRTFVSRKYKYMYIVSHKAASTSIKWALHELHQLDSISFEVDGPYAAERISYIHVPGRLKIHSLLDYTDAEQEEILNSDDWFRFVVVRDPAKRVISYWQDSVLLCEPNTHFLYEQLGKPIPGIDFKIEDLISLDELIEHVIQPANLHTADPHLCYQHSNIFMEAIKQDDYTLSELDALQLNFKEKTGGNLNLSIKNSSVIKQPLYSAQQIRKLREIYEPDYAKLFFDDYKQEVDVGNFHLELIRPIIERNIMAGILHKQWEALAKPVLIPYI